MAYVALKPCCFAGHRFRIGETVPDELIHPGNARNAVKMGLIAEHAGEAGTPAKTPETPVIPPVEKMTVCIRAEEGDLPLDLTQAGLQAVVDVLTSKVDVAEPIIEAMTDGDALILLHLTDTRKSVKNASEARAKALNENLEESVGEQ
jgi:hypothetical protein